jgi:hypothetical protein
MLETPSSTSPTQAQSADKHILYERAVQHPPADVEFIQRTFRKYRGRAPRVFREDFCGTAALCADWVRSHRDNRAYGIDLDERTLNWGIRQHIVPLGPPAARVTLIRRDVRDRADFVSDAVAAFNFSYFTFKDRKTLGGYFRSVRAGLARDGILYLDLFGGPESMDLREERTDFGDFTYVWDQSAFNPITHAITCNIHFEFPDGSRLERAFRYHWRLWQIPELQDLLAECGFKESVVYWEGTDKESGEGNGIYRPSRTGDNAPAYVCYLVAIK